MSQSRTPPKRAAAVLWETKRCAQEQRTITYGELARKVGSGPQNMGAPLGYIRDEVCNRFGRPRLDALAVQKNSRIPSIGFFADVNADDAAARWLEMVREVHTYDWSGVEIDD